MATGTPLSPSARASLLKQLCRSPLFSLAGRYDLARLLSQAQQFTIARGEKLCEAGAAATAVYVLLEGQYDIDGKLSVDIGARGAPFIGLESAVRDGALEVTVTALSDGKYLAFDAAFARELYHSSPPLRAAMLPMLEAAGRAEASADEDRAAVVRFESRFPDTPLSFLIELLGREVASAFHERVVIVRPAKGEPGAPQKIPIDGLGELYRVAADAAWIQKNRGRYDYIFLDGLDVRDDAVHIVVRLVHAAVPRDTPAPPVPWILQTVVIQPAPLPCAKTLTLVNANRDDLVTADACRLHVSFDALRRLQQHWSDDAKLSSLDERLRASLGVWARALTLRRTGIAISGGGVFAMQGAYVIEELCRRKVPIDVITGTSGGALVGSYYGAKGLAGLATLVEQGDRGVLDAVVLASFLAGCVLESFLACTLGDPCIEHLPYTEFYPGSSALAGGKGVVAVRGPLALGVRAASSTPPIFPATITSGERLADGAYTNNLPVQALNYFNTTLTLAVNAYPPSRMPLVPCVPECVSQLFASLGLLNRGLTFTTAFNLLASISGEVESGFATVPYNARSNMIAPYLVMPDFYRSSQVIVTASTNEALNAAIDEFEARWDAIRNRSRPPRVPPVARAAAVDVPVGAA